MNTQNRRDNVVLNRLEPGTTVYIKSEGLLTKMANRYYGPFIIKRSTEGGNYILTNPLNEELKNSYSRQKLKVVSSSIENEKIFFIFSPTRKKVLRSQSSMFNKAKNVENTGLGTKASRAKISFENLHNFPV